MWENRNCGLVYFGLESGPVAILREYDNEMSECIRSGKYRYILRNLASREGSAMAIITESFH